jgi:hypothetical protein
MIMRVFLKKAKNIDKPTGGRISWPADSFCVVDDALGQEWLDSGEAWRATDDNVAIEPEPEPELEPEPESMVDEETPPAGFPTPDFDDTVDG